MCRCSKNGTRRDDQVKLLNAEDLYCFRRISSVLVAPFADPSTLFLRSQIFRKNTLSYFIFHVRVLILDPLAADSVSLSFSLSLITLCHKDDSKVSDTATLAASVPPTFLTACVAGYSFSLLSQRAWRHFYGSMSDYAQQYLVTAFAFELLFLLALDEMDEFLANSPVSDAATFEQVWCEIAERYALPGTDSVSPGLFPVRDLWFMAPSLLKRPLTGIVKALALVTVLGTLPFGRNHIQLEGYYVRLLNPHEGRNPLLRLLRSGYPSPFKEETIQKAAFAIADFLAL